MSDAITIDSASSVMIERAKEGGFSTAFSRVEEMRPCPIGLDGRCCKHCFMGPCRITRGGQTGICGATLETITARNLARAVAAGGSAHSDHGRDLVLTLLAVAKGEAPGYSIRDEGKLWNVARLMDIEVAGRPKEEIAREVAEKALNEFGKQTGELLFVGRAPKRRQEIWRQLGIAPRGIDREVVELMHRTAIGVDQDAGNILTQALRAALADGWGGSMLATDISDILFGTPAPLLSRMNLGVLREDEVNLIVHGHDPTLSELVVAVAGDPEIIEYAKSKGAKGINLAGICCSANEVLMRQGIPVAGNFLQQELAIMTGAVDAMVVDIQCIMQAIGPLSEEFHTKVITTSPKAKMPYAVHMEFNPEENGLEVAREILRTAIDNFPNRDSIHIPEFKSPVVPGFSHEYITYMQGGLYRGSFRPLNDAVMAGRIRGVAGVVGCNNPRVAHDAIFSHVVRELIANDVLVAQTGCGAIASAKFGLMLGEAMDYAGPGLRQVCEAIGIPPILHMGPCVDNSRILTVLSQMATEGGLGEDIADIPGVGIAPEWMSEKALCIAAYFVASGVYTLMGVGSPVGGSEEVTRLISEGWEGQVGGKLEFEPSPEGIVEKALTHIDAKRNALGLAEYDPDRFDISGDWRMKELLTVPAEERLGSLRDFTNVPGS